MRTSRYDNKIFHEHELVALDLEIFKLFQEYRVLATNVIHAFVGRDYTTVQRRLTYLASPVYSFKTKKLQHAGIFERFNFNGSTNVYAVFNYRLTDYGRERLADAGFPPWDEYDHSHVDHQAFLDVAMAGIELGLRNTSQRLIKWPAIKHQTPGLPKDPFKYDDLIPDFRPFVIAAEDRSCLFLTEAERTSKGHTRIRQKLQMYKDKWPLILKRFDVRQAKILYITANQGLAENLLDDILTVYPKGCSEILVTTMDDYTVIGRKPEIPTHLIETPSKRAGKPDFSLKTLSEV